jgi:nitrite reductase/ring-hydroxylating ferredoxin subunit
MRDCSRRRFCQATGAGLVTLGIAGCDPTGAPRLQIGGIDESNPVTNNGGGVGGNGNDSPDMAQGPTGGGGGSTGGGGGSTGGGGGSTGGGGGSTGGGGGSTGGGSTPDMATGGSGGTCASGAYNAGASSSFSNGTTKGPVSAGNTRILIMKDANGIYAVDCVCPHQQCDVGPQGGQLYCPCHGATWDMNGENYTSPGKHNLYHYQVCVDASGNVMVDTSKQVPATTRA